MYLYLQSSQDCVTTLTYSDKTSQSNARRYQVRHVWREGHVNSDLAKHKTYDELYYVKNVIYWIMNYKYTFRKPCSWSIVNLASLDDTIRDIKPYCQALSIHISTSIMLIPFEHLVKSVTSCVEILMYM